MTGSRLKAKQKILRARNIDLCVWVGRVESAKNRDIKSLSTKTFFEGPRSHLDHAGELVAHRDVLVAAVAEISLQCILQLT
jgi:hypothetical protein